MKLHVLGTGNGGAINCYNTCFCIENKGLLLLVDGGGGNGVLKQIEKSGLNLSKLHDIVVTHNHTDHILGIIWILRELSRMIRFDNSYIGQCNLYASEITISALNTLCDLLFSVKQKQSVKEVIKFITVKDGENKKVADMNLQFFDVKARKDYQLAFTINSNEICFGGDEPLNELNFQLAKNCKWFLHEAFCLESQKEIFKPHEKMHITVKESAEIAEKVGAKNLVLWHTQDNNLKNRKKLYTKEAKKYFSGNVFVPDDLEVIDLK